MSGRNDSLADEILMRARQEARRFGVRNLNAGRLAQLFAGRALPGRLEQLAGAACQKLRQEITTTPPPGSPAAVDPAKMFECGPQKMRLSLAGCARLWLGAQQRRPEPWEGRHACVACPVGAAHAGARVSPVASLVEGLRAVCARCLGAANRLINGRFCISCYNRHCEALRGRNARGGRPRLAQELSTIEVAVFTGGAVRLLTEPHSRDGTEVLVHLARQAEGVASFGWGMIGPGDSVDMAVAA